MSDPVEIPPRNLFFKDKWYNRLKWLVQILLPATGTFYFTIASIWGLPEADRVVGTITAITLFLGLLLGLSARNYNASDARFEGSVTVLKGSESDKQYAGKKEVTLKVNRVDEMPGNDG